MRHDRLQTERALDDVARYPEGAAVEDVPSVAPYPRGAMGPLSGPPPRRRRASRRTRALGFLLVASVGFLLGIQFQKLLAPPAPAVGSAPADSGPDGAASPEAAQEAESGGVPPTELVRGEVVAIRGPVVYVRTVDGAAVKVRATAGRPARGVASPTP